MLNKMGYKGKGLGRQENRITEPITVQKHVFKVDNNRAEKKVVIYIFRLDPKSDG